MLAAGVGALLGGCAAGARTPSGAPTGPSKGTPTGRTATPASPPATSIAVLPATQRWQPSPGDLEPGCKVAAVRAVERAGRGADRALQVLDAQYGGLLANSASVLVVTRTWTLVDGSVRTGGRTDDVRLSRLGSSWRVDAVHPSRPGPARSVSPVARRVLTDDRIDLPPAARRDVRSGRVHDAPLSALLVLAQAYRIGVSVVRSGHPLHVFGTHRLSDHPQGRAFDTWRIDGHAVVDPRTSRALVTEYMHAVAAAGSYNVGGPSLLGSAPQWFSDATHHDHVHAGFTG